MINLKCPTEPAAARAHHERVVADAETGNPVTAQGRALRASGRYWQEFDLCIGECSGCGSTLSFRTPFSKEAA